MGGGLRGINPLSLFIHAPFSKIRIYTCASDGTLDIETRVANGARGGWAGVKMYSANMDLPASKWSDPARVMLEPGLPQRLYSPAAGPPRCLPPRSLGASHPAPSSARAPPPPLCSTCGTGSPDILYTRSRTPLYWLLLLPYYNSSSLTLARSV